MTTQEGRVRPLNFLLKNNLTCKGFRNNRVKTLVAVGFVVLGPTRSIGSSQATFGEFPPNGKIKLAFLIKSIILVDM